MHHPSKGPNDRASGVRLRGLDEHTNGQGKPCRFSVSPECQATNGSDTASLERTNTVTCWA